MYQVGDLIVYGSTGVCKVEEICQKHVGFSKQASETQLYYTLKPVYKTEVIYAPVENSKVFTRYVITATEAERLIDLIPFIKAKEYTATTMQDLKNQYESAASTFNCLDLIELTMSIYAKKKELEKQKKRVGQIDERYMKRAEEMLFCEFATALDMSVEDVSEYIAKKVANQTAEIA